MVVDRFVFSSFLSSHAGYRPPAAGYALRAVQASDVKPKRVGFVRGQTDPVVFERSVGDVGQDVPLLESLTFASEFRSKEIGTGKKSVAFSMVFRASDRTLTREEADEAQKTLLDAVSKSLGATLRT